MIKRVDKRLQAVQCLTGNKIKIIACITMLIDHFSKIFLESIMNDKLFPLYLAGGMSTEQFYGIDAFQKNILNGIGTIAFPLFCLLLSEGFFYTKNRKRYIGGMLAFALISEVPFDIGFFSRYSIVKLLKAVEKVKPDLDAIQPEKTLTGAVKGVTVEQVKELKAAVIRGAAAEQKVRELKVENQQLQQKIPSMKEKLKEAQERKRLENENRQLKVQVEYLEKDLSWERGISARLQEGIGAVLDFLDQHLPEQFRPLVEKARELLPVPEVQQPEREQERGHTWGGMEL